MENGTMSSENGNAISRRHFMKAASVSGAVIGSVMTAGAAVGQTVSASGEGKQAAPAPPDRQAADLDIPEPVKKKMGWAIVGLGKLAVEEILPAFGECTGSRVVALVSGHPDKAGQLAEVYGVAPDRIYNYENFDTLAEADDVDAVYIVLPNSMHAEYTIRALKAGKHVLCEKPMAANLEECARMSAASEATGKKLMIAYRLHYEPLNRKVMQMCEAGKLGKLKLFVSSNCQNVESPNIRLSSKLAGGPVGDVGVYSINAARYVIGEEPVEVFASEHRPDNDMRFSEVPESVSFTLKYPSGVMAQCVCSFGSAGSQRYEVIGEKGVIVMDPAFPYRGLKLTVRRQGTEEGPPEIADLNLRQVNHFASEMDHFSKCIRDNITPRTTAAMGTADMRIVHAIGESARTGKPVSLA